MAKKKQKEIINDCKLCINSFYSSTENDLYCRTKVKDKEAPTEVGKTETVIDCSWYVESRK